MTAVPAGSSSTRPRALLPILSPASRRFAMWLGLIVLAALVVRLVYILTLAERNPDGGDPFYYHVQANLLADGKGFAEPFTWVREGRIIPTAVHPPLFSVVLMVSSLLGGDGYLAHKLVACLIGAATAGVIGLVAREIAGNRAGLIAAGLAALYPDLWIVDGILMPEGLFALTIALTMLVAYRLWRAPSVALAGALGLFIGLAALTRGEAIGLVVVLTLPLVLLLRQCDMRRRVALLAVAGGVTALTISPWAIHNATRFERPVLLSTNGEEVLAYANCDLTYGEPFLGFWANECHYGDPQGDESERAKFWRDQGIEYAMDHKGRLPVVVAARLGRLWNVFRPEQTLLMDTIEGRRKDVARVGLYTYWAMLPLAVAGVVLIRRRRLTTVIPPLAQVVLVSLVAIYAYGATRFRMPGDVAVVVLAGVALDAAVSAFLARRPPPDGTPASADGPPSMQREADLVRPSAPS